MTDEMHRSSSNLERLLVLLIVLELVSKAM
jgi:hypothetical protein